MPSLDKLLRRRIIIGIHGLANKPPKKLLKTWWEASIREGLDNIGAPERDFRFELVYWADFLHEKPQDPDISYEKHELYIDDPYIPGRGGYEDFKPSELRKKFLDKLEKKLDRIFFEEKSFINYEYFTNLIIRNLFKDLDAYYNKNCPVTAYANLPTREALRGRLADLLHKHRNKSILLFSHSMGTIIAYDVLTRMVPDVTVDTFITMGSPLGLPVIMKRIYEEQGRDYRKEKQLPAPENIARAWYNFSDLGDPVAANYNLADDYRPNSKGLGPQDVIVYNNYKYGKLRDPHKSYGYLRAPEVARVIEEFLAREKGTWLGRWFDKAAGFLG